MLSIDQKRASFTAVHVIKDVRENFMQDGALHNLKKGME